MLKHLLLAAAFVLAPAAVMADEAPAPTAVAGQEGQINFACRDAGSLHDFAVILDSGEGLEPQLVTETAMALLLHDKCAYFPVPGGITFKYVEQVGDGTQNHEVWKASIEGSDHPWYVLHKTTGA